MKKHLFFAALNLLAATFLFAQSPAAPEQNDPQAKKLLDKVRKKYEGYKTVEATFSLQIETPGQAKETQKGTIGQAGEKFRLDMDGQTIISDGQSTWVYLKTQNEVQINNAESSDESAFITPMELLRRYQKGDYFYAITEKTTENGRIFTQIEFKPKDKKSEYSKLRVSIDPKTNTIEAVKAFAKDGSRYTFKITRTTPNKKFEATHFTFEAAKFPGVRVEDLRI